MVESDSITVNGLSSRIALRIFVITYLLCCWTIIGYVIGWGDPDNSLHTSALAWSFGTSFATLFAYCVDNWNVIRNTLVA